MLEQQGFRVTRGVADIPTAVMGEAGEGGPVIAILGEYRCPAGPQPGGRNRRAASRLSPGGNGHGCGHNLLGSGSLMAATAVKDYLEANGLDGRVRYYGCPAEEGGSAKGFMVRAGVFDDVDIAISWHPAAFRRRQQSRSRSPATRSTSTSPAAPRMPRPRPISAAALSMRSS